MTANNNAVILDAVAAAGRNVTITDAIMGGTLEFTTDGASTLTIQCHDPYRKLLQAEFTKSFDLEYAGQWFRLVKISKSGTTVTLTFEDRNVTYLRGHTRPRKISRNKQTRAEFVRSLVREVKQSPIGFYCPDVDERQPIGKSTEDQQPAQRTEADRTAKHQKGLSDSGSLTVKGVPATKEQRDNMQRVLDVADTLKAGPKATKSVVEAVIVESQAKNLSYGDRDSLGILQVRVSTSGSAARSRDIEWCVREFLKVGFYTDPELGGGGAMAIARRHPEATAGRVAQATQGSAVPDAYEQWSAEAGAWLDAYGGASGTDSGGADATTTTREQYEFTRGQPGQPEDSWTAIQRLASEVNWRAFMYRGTLNFVDDERLMQAKARYVINEDVAGVTSIDFDIDQGKVDGQVTVTCRTGLFDIPPGSVMALRNMGIADGRWLVTDVSVDLFGVNDTTVTLTAPTPKLPEPDTTTTTGTGSASDVAGTRKGSLRDRIIAEAEKTLTTKTGFCRYSQNGQTTDNPNPPAPNRTDCSQWVRAVYLRAGAKDPGANTWQMITNGKLTHSPRPGDLLISIEHVELYVSGDKTYGHGSPPIDEGSVAYYRAHPPKGQAMYFITFDFLGS